MIHDVYDGIGMEGNLTHVHFLFSGQGQGLFEELWEYNTSSGSFLLKGIYSHQSDTLIVKGLDATKEILSWKTFKSVELVNGKALTTAAAEGKVHAGLGRYPKIWRQINGRCLE